MDLVMSDHVYHLQAVILGGIAGIGSRPQRRGW
jgi:nitrate reductase gamma subunit